MFRIVIEKIGSLGAIITAMGCGNCFPALAALGASLGLGFLSPYEGLFINKLLPIFAVIVLLSNSINWYLHRIHWRGMLSITGPMVVLMSLYLFWKYAWSTYFFYAGLFLMFIVAIYELVDPPNKTCTKKSANINTMDGSYGKP